MTTHGFDDLPQDAQIMRKLVANSAGNLGIYASILEAGTVSSGDFVSMI
jgi:MOSC domain-containing protein YiiM